MNRISVSTFSACSKSRFLSPILFFCKKSQRNIIHNISSLNFNIDMSKTNHVGNTHPFCPCVQGKCLRTIDKKPLKRLINNLHIERDLIIFIFEDLLKEQRAFKQHLKLSLIDCLQVGRGMEKCKCGSIKNGKNNFSSPTCHHSSLTTCKVFESNRPLVKRSFR